MERRDEEVQQLMRLLDTLQGEGWAEVPLEVLEERIEGEEVEIRDVRGLIEHMVQEGYLVLKHRLRGQLSVWPTAHGETLR